VSKLLKKHSQIISIPRPDFFYFCFYLVRTCSTWNVHVLRNILDASYSNIQAGSRCSPVPLTRIAVGHGYGAGPLRPKQKNLHFRSIRVCLSLSLTHTHTVTLTLSGQCRTRDIIRWDSVGISVSESVRVCRYDSVSSVTSESASLSQ
jgi:hypothetical protein